MTPDLRQPRVFLPAVSSGLLLWTAFFPLNFGPAAFVALVPFLTLVRAEGVSARRRYLAAYVGGVAFFLPALQWVRVAHPAMYASWVCMALIGCGFYFPAALWLMRRLDRLGRPPLGLTLPVVWVALEYVRSHFPFGFEFLKAIGCHQYVGFGWYFLGHTQHDWVRLIQIADLGGVYAVSVVVAIVNGTVAEWLLRLPSVRGLLGWKPEFRRGFVREMWTAVLGVFALLLAIGYGSAQLVHPPFEPGPKVTALQPNFTQDIKMGDARFVTQDMFELTDAAVRRQPDLIIWPETCFPAGLTDVTPDGRASEWPNEIREGMTAINPKLSEIVFQRWRKPVLIGTGLDEWDGVKTWRFNSAVLLDRDGSRLGRYDKTHLVPFGEYVPFRETFPWLKAFTPYRHDYSCKPGETMTRFGFMVNDKRWTFGVLICYEDTEPVFARRYNLPAGGQKPVDFLVNISNDGWFRGSEEHEQHLAICKFRAIEARRSVVRAVNMGISAIIDSDGRIQALPADSIAESKRHRGLVTDRITLDTRESPYARYGDWVPAGCWAAVGLGLLLSWVRRRPT